MICHFWIMSIFESCLFLIGVNTHIKFEVNPIRHSRVIADQIFWHEHIMTNHFFNLVHFRIMSCPHYSEHAYQIWSESDKAFQSYSRSKILAWVHYDEPFSNHVHFESCFAHIGMNTHIKFEVNPIRHSRVIADKRFWHERIMICHFWITSIFESCLVLIGVNTHIKFEVNPIRHSRVIADQRFWHECIMMNHFRIMSIFNSKVGIGNMYMHTKF